MAYTLAQFCTESRAILKSQPLASALTQVADRLARYFPDRRDPTGITHTLFDMIRARVFAISCGYNEDAVDLDFLRMRSSTPAGAAYSKTLVENPHPVPGRWALRPECCT